MSASHGGQPVRTKRRRPDDVPAQAQRELADLLARRMTGRPIDELEGDPRTGPKAWQAMVEDAVTDVLLAGWRPAQDTAPTDHR